METTSDGRTTYYPVQGPGAIVNVSKVVDAAGNTHSFLYSSGLLQTIQDSVGRLVTFGYSSGLLQTVQDWAGRVTNFGYDTNSVPGKPLLTTMTGPTGCQTGYRYDTNARLTGVIDANDYG